MEDIAATRGPHDPDDMRTKPGLMMAAPAAVAVVAGESAAVRFSWVQQVPVSVQSIIHTTRKDYLPVLSLYECPYYEYEYCLTVVPIHTAILYCTRTRVAVPRHAPSFILIRNEIVIVAISNDE